MVKNSYDFAALGDNFRKSVFVGIFSGVITILSVYFLGEKTNHAVFGVADSIGDEFNTFFIILANIMLLVWIFRRKMYSGFWLVLAVNGLSTAIVQFVKLNFSETWMQRPNGGNGGFPSGHTTYSFSMALLLSTIFPRLRWVWFACAAIISWSRVPSFWHTELQIVAGIIFGLSFMAVLINYWIKYFAKRQEKSRG